MVFIKVDLIKLGSFIDNLRDWIVDAESSRKAVRDKVSAEDPAQIRDVVSDSSTMLRVTNHLSSLRGSLETRKINVEAVNRETGRLNTDAECGYYLPTENTEDNTANVTEHNIKAIQAAKADAKADYEYRVNNKRGGRSTAETEEKYKDNPVYASTYIHELGKQPGVDKNDSGIHVFLDMLDPIDSGAGSPGQDRMMHILAAASRDEVNGAKLAQDIYANGGKQVDGYWYQERRWALTYALSYEKTTFGTDFLTTLASKAENDPDASSWYYGDTKNIGGREYTADILAGAMSAMSRNPEAALNYLAGDVTSDSNGVVHPSEETRKRWEKLSTRTWDGGLQYGSGTNAFTSALAAASAYRNKSDDEAHVKNADARATWLAGRTIEMFSSDKYQAHSWNSELPEDSKKNLAIVLGNSPEEIEAASRGWNVASPKYVKGPHMYAGNGNAISREQVTTLLYRIVDNEDAAATVAAKAGDYHRNRIDQALDDEPSQEKLQEKYGNAAATNSYLQTVISERYKGNHEANEATETAINNSAAVFAAVATGGVSLPALGVSAGAATAVGTAAGVASASVPIGSSFAMNVIGAPEESKKKDEAPGEKMLMAQALADGGNRKIFKEETQKSLASNNINRKDRATLDKEYLEEAKGWLDNGGRDGDAGVQAVQTNVDQGYKDGATNATSTIQKKRQWYQGNYRV